jgi:hypothetical protein
LKIFVTANDYMVASKTIDALTASGHEIVSDWNDKEPVDDVGRTDLDRAVSAHRSFQHIDDSEAVVSHTVGPMVSFTQGIHVGFALGRGKPVVAIGLSQSYMMFDNWLTRVKSVGEAIEKLKLG